MKSPVRSRSSAAFAAATLLVLSTFAAALQPEKGSQPTQPPRPAPTAPTGPADGQPGDRPPQGPGRGEPRRGGPGGQPTNVEGAMKLMNGNLRRLKGQISDAAKKDDNLRLIGEVERGCILAKNMQPERLQDIKDDAERAKLAATFRQDLVDLMRKLLDIEQNLIDGKNEAAASTLQEVVKMRDAGHKAMGVDEK
jgi:hypothetical protein